MINNRMSPKTNVLTGITFFRQDKIDSSFYYTKITLFLLILSLSLITSYAIGSEIISGTGSADAVPFLSFNMDFDPGWSTEGMWSFGQPQGYDDDPDSGYTGLNVYGYNLAGEYTNNSPRHWLTTLPLNCTGHSEITLKFQRWLGVESSYWDEAVIEASNDGINWTSVWSHSGGSINDREWTEVNYDLSEIADLEPTVYLRWGMGETDGSVTYCGWNIDDVSLIGRPHDDLTVLPVVHSGHAFVSSGHPGGPFLPVNYTYTLKNTGSGTLSWTASHNADWLNLHPSSGSLSPGGSAEVSATIDSNASTLPEAVYADDLVFRNTTSGIKHTRNVSLDVFTTPEVMVSPMSGLAVTNAPGQVQKCTVFVSNRISADNHLNYYATSRETEREELLSRAALGIEPPSATHNFSVVAANAEYQTGQLLVRFIQGIPTVERKKTIASLGGSILREFSLIPGLCLVDLNDPDQLEASLPLFNSELGILYAQPNYLLKTETIPDDSEIGELWGMHNTGQTGGSVDADIDAPEAWDLTVGKHDVIVAVIDTGVDYTHPDLNANIWVNPGEIAGNGIDDDGNGFIDDVHGYDFVNNDADPMDDNGHGTHCSGTIGAEGNNAEGVVGVAWKVRIMALKFLSSGGWGSTADAISCIEYATMMGAKVLSNSWGGGPYDQALKDVIDAAGAVGIPFVAAAGNSGTDNDITPRYPSCYDSENIISVVNTDHNDNKSGSSCYGLKSTDLAAPGTAILSCWPGGGYNSISGTSMATPHVAGACALMLSLNPSINVQEMKQILINTVDPTLPGMCASGGRLNLAKALKEAGAPWISIYPVEGSNISPGDSRPLTVYFDAADCWPGNYTGEVVIISNDRGNPEVSIPVSMHVTSDYLTVTPNQIFEASGTENGPFHMDANSYTLRNDGSVNLEWVINSYPAWIDISQLNGTLSAGQEKVVEMSFNEVTAALPPGLYEGVIGFRNCESGLIYTRTVRLDISARPNDIFFEELFNSSPGWPTEGQWEFGQPIGGGSHNMDPTSGISGAFVYGYDLSGDYADEMQQYWLTTSAIDCSKHRNIVLRFYRWLGVEYSDFDKASLEISNDGSTWHKIWSNDKIAIMDTEWKKVSYDISHVADMQPNVYIRWGIGPTDASETYPGWNIDDMTLSGEPLPQLLHHFSWSTIAPTQTVNSATPVRIFARDAFGSVVTGFIDSVSLSAEAQTEHPVIISEINTGSPNAIEFQNITEKTVDLSGWQIFIYDSNGTNTYNLLPVFSIPEGSLCEPGQLFSLTEYGSAPATYPNFYNGSSIYWHSSSSGAVLLMDSSGKVIDFVCFDYSAIPPTSIYQPIVVTEDIWSGNPVAAGVFYGNTYQRIGSRNHNSRFDWIMQPDSMGIINDGLITPFDNARKPVSISPEQSGLFQNGIWSGSIKIFDPETNIVLIADDLNGHRADSAPFTAFRQMIDSDGDGIPDQWETTHFGHPANCSATNDFDGDGASAYAEYIAGTDPRISSSVFSLNTCTNTTNGIVIEWQSIPGRIYHMQWTSNLGISGFETLENRIQHPQNSYTDTVHQTKTSGFYKMEVELE